MHWLIWLAISLGSVCLLAFLFWLIYPKLSQIIPWEQWIPEGELGPESCKLLKTIIQKEGARKLFEIGFNRGTSSRAMLQANSETTVVSFDLGRHSYVTRSKEEIDADFPNRHRLIIGYSNVSLPEHLYTESKKDFYDLALIDGGHFGDVPATDLKYALLLVRPGGTIILDDCLPDDGLKLIERWKEAPSRAVKELLQLQNPPILLDKYEANLCILKKLPLVK